MLFSLRILKFLKKAFGKDVSSQQMAWGFAIGLAVGLVPKGNLTAGLLLAVLCALRVNLGVGMLSAVFFSWVGLLADPLSHKIGLALLSFESLGPFWTAFFELPIIPWTNLNNTVVLGSFVLGLSLLYPAYRFSWPVFDRCNRRLMLRMQLLFWLALAWRPAWVKKQGGS